mmetsp:Transcript_20962/g.31055  ORF Transcript_20962/g.31055 Transcript_20962/m.31055 type:complete len:152 (+) Transcript_20962:130-585(+)|eukprot:CAMPEP_0194217280 /NCGR_PEP_ID=MMETSP0156-20130528/20877_1 /TAXON_ID=33649 /ORGANISM="Thalassionema nitzschioides, Strain L26-B" /LENGTH=151 /DNA_ID=CAMNT_0038946287 /DNA_START=78 /DNA_END=533 /DNA_ORIENTATION=+
MKHSVLFSIFVSFAVAQRQGGWQNPEDNYNDDYGRNYDDKNLYMDYAAKQQEKAMGSVGWPKLLLAGVGGYILGSKFPFTKKGNAPKLRFKLKQRVECYMGGSWAKGKIVKLWYPIDEGRWVPYQVLLEDGKMIYAPNDVDHTIRAEKKKK